jgi:uncharacterized membrane protein
LKPTFNRTKILGITAIVGLFVLEAVLATLTEARYDMGIWFNTGIWMKLGINIYLPPKHLGYPPLWALWCLVAYQIYEFFANNLEIWRLAIKLPMILAQFSLAFAMFKFAQKRFDLKTAWKIFWITLSCSFFIYIGAFWGQINLLSAFLTFMAFYAVTEKHPAVGAILLGIAVTLKIYPLIVLPAFLAYIWKNKDLKEAVKFFLYTCAVPIVFTLSMFAFYGWDILYFLKTIFYWTPVFENNPTQIQGGCMNIWSFLGLYGVKISEIWLLRFLWIPVLAVAAFFWFRKPKMNIADFNLALISFYVLFMIFYGWATEQTFLDPLPFIFLQILAFRPKLSHLYALVGIQLLVYGFSLVNGGPSIFQPLVMHFSTTTVTAAETINAANTTIFWQIRGFLGLAISLSLAAFLLTLLEPEVWKNWWGAASKAVVRLLGKKSSVPALA